MNIKIIFILFVTSIIPSISHSAENSFCPKKLFVAYGNGILTDIDSAIDSTNLLALQLTEKVKGGNLENAIEFGTAYNPTEGKWLDLVESLNQLIEGQVSLYLRFLAGLVPMPDYFLEKFESIIANFDTDVIEANSVVKKHIENWNDILTADNVIGILVAHSQGNLFANIVFTGIHSTKRDRFGIVSVANPASFTAGGGPYTSNFVDIVVNLVPGARPPNVHNFLGFNPSDFTGHLFGPSYLLQGHDSQKKIMNDIFNNINGRNANCMPGKYTVRQSTYQFGAIDDFFASSNIPFVQFSSRFGGSPRTVGDRNLTDHRSITLYAERPNPHFLLPVPCTLEDPCTIVVECFAQIKPPIPPNILSVPLGTFSCSSIISIDTADENYALMITDDLRPLHPILHKNYDDILELSSSKSLHMATSVLKCDMNKFPNLFTQFSCTTDGFPGGFIRLRKVLRVLRVPPIEQ